ncbi:MAG: glycosyltransferase [Butyricicoccaceae bacterium]
MLINDFGRDPESVETLYIGVDQEQYDETKVEAGLVRKELNIAEDRPIILFPCRIHPQKRPFLMVEIAKQIKQSIPNIAFVVVGDGPQFEELKIAIEREKSDRNGLPRWSAEGYASVLQGQRFDADLLTLGRSCTDGIRVAFDGQTGCYLRRRRSGRVN